MRFYPRCAETALHSATSLPLRGQTTPASRKSFHPRSQRHSPCSLGLPSVAPPQQSFRIRPAPPAKISRPHSRSLFVATYASPGKLLSHKAAKLSAFLLQQRISRISGDKHHIRNAPILE